MNAQERGDLMHFLDQMVQARMEQRDAEAVSLIKDACSKQPDAVYLLVQRALLLEQALHEAGNRISGLQAELDQARAAGRGVPDANAWGSVPSPGRPAPVTAGPGAGYAAPSPSWGSGFLGNVATTAAGVVAGSFLFQGIEHLLGGRSGLSGGTGAQPALAENTTINNYYDAPAGGDLMDTSLADGIDTGDDWI